MILKNNSLTNFFCLSIIFVYSIFINQYFGNAGLHVLDSTIGLGNGHRLTQNQIPFSDYWVTSGLLTDLIQAQFFKILGLNWQVYVFHASIFNCFLSCSIFFFLRYLKFSNIENLIYSISTATIMYPLAGVVLVDFHSLILSIIALITFFYAIKEKNIKFLTIVPGIFLLAFLCKQIPAGYFIICVTFTTLIYCLKNKIIWPLCYLALGSIVSLIAFFLIIYYFEIKFDDFFTQYIKFAITIFSNSKDSSLLVQLKEITKIKYFLILLIFFFINIFSKENNLNKNSFLIISTITTIAVVVFFTEIFTNNQNVMLGLIPLTVALISCLFKNEDHFPKTKILLYFIIILLFCRLLIINYNYLFIIFFLILTFMVNKKIIFKFTSLFIIFTIILTSFYYEKFVKIRRFNDIFHDVSVYVHGHEISKKFNGLRWKTNIVDTKEEIKMILYVKNLEKMNDKILIISNLQIFNFLLDKKNNSPTKYWMKDKSYPSVNNNFRKEFEFFFKEKMKNANINEILIVNDNDFEIESFNWLKRCSTLKNNKDFGIKHYLIKEDCL